MIVEARLRALHMRDPIPIQLGNLASSVKRLGFVIHTQKSETIVRQLLRECHSFAGWTSPETNFETRLALADLQTDLDKWWKYFEGGKIEEPWRVEVNAACEKWSKKLLEFSGLVRPSEPSSREP